MKMKPHQSGKTMRDTGIYDMRDYRTLELRVGVLVKIRTFEARPAQRKEWGQKEEERGTVICVCRWWWRQWCEVDDIVLYWVTLKYPKMLLCPSPIPYLDSTQGAWFPVFTQHSSFSEQRQVAMWSWGEQMGQSAWKVNRDTDPVVLIALTCLFMYYSIPGLGELHLLSFRSASGLRTAALPESIWRTRQAFIWTQGIPYGWLGNTTCLESMFYP